MKSHLSEYVQISMMSRELENFIPAKANFVPLFLNGRCGFRYKNSGSEKFNAGWNKIYRSQAIDRILNILLIPMLLFLAYPAAYAQQITLEGRVSIHNSEYHTGKIEYVEGAIVSAPNTTTETTNRKGIFKLEFAAVDGGNSVTAQVEKAGLEVANPDALQGVAIGRESPLLIFLAEKGQLGQAQTELLNSSLQALKARHQALTASLRKEGVESRAALLELQKQLNREIPSRFEGEQLLNEQLEELANRLPERTEKLARINLDFASATYRQAYELYKQGEMDQAIAALEEATLEKKADAALASLQEWARKGKSKQAAKEKENLQQVVDSYQLKAQAYFLLFHYRDALSLHQKAASLLEKAGVEESMQLAEAQAAVALNYLLLGEDRNALHYQQKNIEIKEQLLGADDPEMASSCNLLAAIYRNLEEYPMALEAQQKVVAIAEQALAPGHPDIAPTYASLAGIYRNMEEYGMALEAQQKAIRIQEQALPPNHPDVARSYSAVAEIHLDEHAHEKALRAQLKALFIQEQALPSGHPDIARSYHNLALIYLNLGDFGRALAIQQKIIAMHEQALPAGHPEIAISYHNLVSTFYFLNELDSALHYEYIAYDMLNEQLPPGHPDLKTAESSFAFLHSTRGERRQAAGQYEEAISDFQKALVFRPDNEDAKKRIAKMQAGQSSRQRDNQEALALKGTTKDKPAPEKSSRVAPPKEARTPAVAHHGFFQATKATSLRAAPTSSSAVLKRLSEGDRLKVIEKTEYYWWKVLCNGQMGYVKALLLEEVK